MTNTDFSMERFQVHSRPRHLRYLFLVDEQFGYSKLTELVRENLRYWGGRYNPIIPVRGGTIIPEYLEFAGMFDPDVICYTDLVDIQLIKDLNIFHPWKYQKYESPHIDGVNALYLAGMLKKQGPVLLSSDLYSVERLFEFYEINFALSRVSWMSDYSIAKDMRQVIISPQNYSQINEILFREKPINHAKLSKINVLTPIMASTSNTYENGSEMVIARDQESLEDLMYYWNRQMYRSYNIIYITVHELVELCKSGSFGHVIYDLTNETNVDVVSLSLNENEVNDLLRNHLEPAMFNREFRYRKTAPFPFIVDEGGTTHYAFFREELQAQSIYGGSNALSIPSLSFADRLHYQQHMWAVDLQLHQAAGDKWLVFPMTTDSNNILKVEGRVNKYRQLSYFVRNGNYSLNAINVNIPMFCDLLPQLIQKPVIHGVPVQTKFKRIALHDSSKRLTGLLRMFNNDFATIDEFFTDKFWMDTFEMLCISERPAGDSISFRELSASCQEVLTQLGIVLGKREETKWNLENLEMGLKHQLDRLCQFGVFIPGFKLKCPQCSSIHWYDLASTGINISCKGCLQNFNFLAETPFNYKLSDLVRNNIFQSRTRRDGNLTVIRTLASMSLRQGYFNVDFSPQIELFDQYEAAKAINELDLCLLADNKLAIGEAKHDSKQFFADKNKSLNALVEVAHEIKPDMVILSCYRDEHARLDKASKYLHHHFSKWNSGPEIFPIKLLEPDYRLLKSAYYLYYH